MISGPTTRTPKKQRAYHQHQCCDKQRGEGCNFCSIVENGGKQKLAETEHCLVISNLFSYSYWDDCRVTEHMMIIPKRHVVSLAELAEDEKLDYMNLAAKYEAEGYSLYARSPGNTTKSVAHQHTHLIKIDNYQRRFMLYLRKPHILWSH